MKIIDKECIACTCNEECDTSVKKGSIKCDMLRFSKKQSKADMIRKMQENTNKQDD